MKTAFISHTSKDKKTADNIVDFLEGENLACWIAPRDINAGINYGAAISKGVRDCPVMVLLYSQHSNASEAVFREIQLAFDTRKHIIPVRIDNTPVDDNLSFYLSSIQWIDAEPGQLRFESLAENIKNLLAMPQKSRTPAAKPPLKQKKSAKGFIAAGIFALAAALAVFAFMTAQTPLSNAPSMPRGRFYPEFGGAMGVFEFRGGGRVTHHAGLMTMTMYYRINENRLIISETPGGIGLEYELSGDMRSFSQDMGFGLATGFEMRWVVFD